MSWRQANGVLPGEARGKRVKVKLRNGRVEGEAPIANGVPTGWPADGTATGAGPAMRWQHDGGPFDVVEWDFA